MSKRIEERNSIIKGILDKVETALGKTHTVSVYVPYNCIPHGCSIEELCISALKAGYTVKLNTEESLVVIR